jgi:hypothetical protein
MSEPYWEPLAAAPSSKSGEEVAAYLYYSNFGPTPITGTGNGDTLFNFPAVSYESVLHYLEMSMSVQDGGGYAIYEIRLHDGPAPGPLLWLGHLRTPEVNPGNPQTIKVPFIPSPAGVHTYQIRWRDITGGRTYTMVNSMHPLVARIVRA